MLKFTFNAIIVVISCYIESNFLLKFYIAVLFN